MTVRETSALFASRGEKRQEKGRKNEIVKNVSKKAGKGNRRCSCVFNVFMSSRCAKIWKAWILDVGC